MRAKWFALALCVTLAVLWAPCVLADDDVVRISTSTPLQIGSVSLGPGSYVLRFSDRYPNSGVLLVMGEDQNILGKVLVKVKNHLGQEIHAATTLVFSDDDPGVVTAVFIGGKGTYYEIVRR